MKRYLFFLGKNRELSILELFSYLIKRKLKYNLIKITDYFAEIEIEFIELNKVINDLGGILKIAEYFDLKDLKIDKKRIFYGVSLFYNNEKVLHELKRIFKEEKARAFLKKPRKGVIFSPKETGKLDIELIVFKEKIAKVVANSHPSIFKERDESRPYFDKLKATSLRLCKILINLSQVKENEILLDPFIGIGSILQEALILGVNAVGSDIDKKSADGTIKNLEFVKKKYNLKSYFKIYNADNKNIDNFVKYADCVVTEPYFGPFFKKIPKYEEVVKIIKEIEKTYYLLLLKLRKIVKKNGLIVFLVPVYKTSRGRVTMDFESIIKELEYEIYSPINSIKIPIKYSLKGSIVERLIYILKNT